MELCPVGALPQKAAPTRFSGVMLGQIAAVAVRRVERTLTWHVVGEDLWREAAILSLWHGGIVLGAALLMRLRAARHPRTRLPLLAAVVREYGFSGPMTDWARALGLDVVMVPGYEQPESRRAALLGLGSSLAAGASLVLPADGHRGPRRSVHPDALWLAAELTVPLLPLAVDARPRALLPTWDRKSVPLPGARVVAVIGSPLPPGSTPADLARALADSERVARDMLS